MEAYADDKLQKGKIAIAKNLLGIGVQIEQIIAATGLTCEDIEDLRN